MASKGGISGGGIVVALGGAVLAYSAVKGKHISTTVRDLLAGQNPATDPRIDQPIGSTSLGGLLGNAIPGGLPGSPPPPSNARAKSNQAIAKPLAAKMGWTEQNGQWQALVTLWNNESGWDNTAYNPTSGATGIPQAVPASKLPAGGQAPYFMALPQILWGLAYIKGRYGTPSAALAFWNRTDPRPFPGHWY